MQSIQDAIAETEAVQLGWPAGFRVSGRGTSRAAVVTTGIGLGTSSSVPLRTRNEYALSPTHVP